MLKYLCFYLCLFFSILIASLQAQNGPIIAVRNVCVGTVVEVKTSDFTCTGITTVPGIVGNTVDMPLFSSNTARRSTSIQLNRVGTYFFFLACTDNTSQRIQVNFVNCDTSQCLGANLVPNPSVETIANCVSPRTTVTGVAANWLDYPQMPPDNQGTVDFYHKLCAGGGFTGILDNNAPRTGEGMLGAFVFRQLNSSGAGQYQFDYPVVQLTTPLTVGQQYRVRFYVKYPNSYSTADRISAGFIVGDPSAAFRQNTAPSGRISFDYIGDPPKASNPVGQYISESVFWTKIENTFTADKPYTHLIVGNLGGLTTALPNVWSYYLFDDFSVQALGSPVTKQITRADTVVCNGQSATLGVKSDAFRTTLKSLTTAQTSAVDTSRLITLPNVTTATCYQLFFEKGGCADSLSFCVRPYPNYDTLIRRTSCRPSDTGLIVRQLRTFRGCDSTVRVQTNLLLRDTTRTVQLVCNQADTGLSVLKLKNTEGCDSIVEITKKWSKPDTTRLELRSCLPKDTGLVVRKLINRLGCDSFILVKTTYIPPVSIDLGRDTVVDAGSRFNLVPILRGDSAASFFWLPPLGLSCTDCPNPEVVLLNSVRYYLTVKSKSGCVSKAERLIQVLDKPFVFVPTVFSPNGDGIHETLTVYANPNRVQNITRFAIFDRWGGLVFSKTNFPMNDEAAGWDGLVNGSKMSGDVFVYLVEFTIWDNKTKVITGDVTVMR